MSAPLYALRHPRDGRYFVGKDDVFLTPQPFDRFSARYVTYPEAVQISDAIRILSMGPLEIVEEKYA
jgi:hypothetical protein